MALVAMASAKGSPGVSVTAATLAGLWSRRCVVADLDPLGSDVLLRFRDEVGGPLDTERGLLSLAAAVRRGGHSTVDPHLQRTEHGLEVLAGVTSATQVRGLGAAWPNIVNALHTMPGTDVLADCGRLSPGSPALTAVERADALVMVTRPSLEQVAHLRERLLGLREPLRMGHLDGIPVGVLTVAEPRDTRSAAEIEQLLRSSGLSVTSLGTIALDENAASAVSAGGGRALRRSLLLRSARDVADRLGVLLAQKPRFAEPQEV